ncbi:MAG TPA: HNH endonuclease signature motif containing protein [Herpetosiphonaceae bacterium]|nr:HNH endonuclease signature motif containing protein [Herpetosiphonaceae bacterium]
MLFIPNHIYHRQTEIHDPYGGQPHGDMSTPKNTPCIFLFTDAQRTENTWISADTFLYAGEGLIGDMSFGWANGAVRDHQLNRKDVHLFENVAARPGYARYIGQMLLTGWSYKQQKDATGKPRQAIVFELTLLGSLDSEAALAAEPALDELATRPLAILRAAALAEAAPVRDAAERVTLARFRSKAIKAYALARAEGVCEGCGQEAPFVSAAGAPFLEVHHIGRLSDGGPDHPDYVAAVCPNCHRRAHASRDAVQFNSQLHSRIRQREELLACAA